MIGISTGAIVDKKDKRDYQYREIIAGASPFDWSADYDVEVDINETLPVKDQNGSLSCGGQAVASYGGVLNKVFDGTFEERSAKFIYSQCYYKPDGGSTMRDLIKLVIGTGWGVEALTPSYENGNAPSEDFMRRVSDITSEAFAKASHDKALSFFQVSTTDVDEIAQAIKNNHGAIIGISLANNGTWRSTYPVYPLAGQVLYNHWVYAGKVKMMNGKKYIGILNSWGKVTGDNGWQWISEDYFKAGFVFAVWTLVYNTQPEVPSFKHTFNYDMEYKSASNIKSEVIALQTALQLDGVYPKSVPITGNYFDITRQAVYDFQVKYAVAPFYILWFNKGKYASKATRAKLNQLYGL